jgi:hypothetical protein
VTLGEALEDQWQHVAAGRARRGERERPALGVAQRAQLVVHPVQGVEHPLRVESDDLAASVSELARPLRRTSFSPIAPSSASTMPDGKLKDAPVRLAAYACTA